MKSKRWKRRNRRDRTEWVKAYVAITWFNQGLKDCSNCYYVPVKRPEGIRLALVNTSPQHRQTQSGT